jgi:uncharacterized protein YndB with AHSA1/START domain
MSRQAVTKHLKILEEANLVVPVWKGREKHHYLNPVPLSLIYSRWIHKFEETRIDGIYQIKENLESQIQEENMSGFMYQIVVSTSAQKVWESLTQAEFTKKFWFGRSVNSDWQIGSEVSIIDPDGKVEASGEVVTFDVNKRLAYTWVSSMDPTKKVTTVVFELQEMGPLTKLTILQDIDAESAMFQQAAAGWTFILCGLKTYLETGEAMPAIPWSK